MRILHVNSYSAKSPFYKNLYEKQLAHGLDIAVYVPSYNRIADSGAVFNTYTTFVKNHSKADRLLFRVKHYKIRKHIQKTYRLDQFDVVHAHSLFSNGYIAYKIKQRYHVPYMVGRDFSEYQCECLFFKYMKHLKGTGLAVLDEASAIIFLSEAYRDAVFQKFIPAGYMAGVYEKVFCSPKWDR